MKRIIRGLSIGHAVASFSCLVAPAHDQKAPGPASPAGPVASSCVAVTAPFTGTLCSQPDGRRHAAVVIFGGYGGDSEARRYASKFAAEGYVAASVAYYGVSGVPPTLVDVPVEIGVGAVHTIAGRDDVDVARVTVMGTSKGGEYALLVASTTRDAKAVIANVPSPFAWFGLGNQGAPTGCSWSSGGKSLPCVPQDADAGRKVWQAMTSSAAVSFRNSYESSRQDAAAVEGAFFSLERIAGPVLCLAGDDDQVWNSTAHCDLAMAYLRHRGHAFADRAVSYPGAGHLFMIADRGPRAAMNSAPMGSTRMAFGGTPDADARAATAAWAEIGGFLSKLAAK